MTLCWNRLPVDCYLFVDILSPVATTDKPVDCCLLFISPSKGTCNWCYCFAAQQQLLSTVQLHPTKQMVDFGLSADFPLLSPAWLWCHHLFFGNNCCRSWCHHCATNALITPALCPLPPALHHDQCHYHCSWSYLSLLLSSSPLLLSQVPTVHNSVQLVTIEK